jgi:hypothetical protein
MKDTRELAREWLGGNYCGSFWPSHVDSLTTLLEQVKAEGLESEQPCSKTGKEHRWHSEVIVRCRDCRVDLPAAPEGLAAVVGEGISRMESMLHEYREAGESERPFVIGCTDWVEMARAALRTLKVNDGAQK